MSDRDSRRVHHDETRRGRSDVGGLRRGHDRFLLPAVVGRSRRSREI